VPQSQSTPIWRIEGLHAKQVFKELQWAGLNTVGAVMTKHEKFISAHADHPLRIAVGKRNFGKVRNKQITWLELVQTLAKPLITEETLEEYLELPESEQLALKSSAGFWIGGPCDNGHRSADAIRSRSVITLDIDEAPAEILDRLRRSETGISGYEFVVHLTRKHTRDKPRLRIAVPTNMPIAPNE
jgi:putative DNA primase/helicase